jgi:hypothetical protein
MCPTERERAAATQFVGEFAAWLSDHPDVDGEDDDDEDLP